MPIDISASHYATGTATVAGTVVTGQGTTWLGAVRPGDLFGTHKGSGVRIASVNSNTSLTLAYAVAGLNQTAAVYEIQRTPYDIGYLAAIEDMIRKYGDDILVVGPASAVDERIAVYDGTTGKLIKDGGKTIAELVVSVFYKADARAVAFTKTGAFTVSVKPGTIIEVAGAIYTFASATAVTMPGSPAAGTDYAIWIKPDGTLQATADFVSPPAAGSRKIGGFHYAPGGNSPARAGGNTTPGINEYSLWDVKFRPSCPDPRGMALVAGSFWVDIYLLGVNHHTDGSSKYNVTIADGSSPPKIPTAFGGNGSAIYGSLNWWEAAEALESHGKQQLDYAEFAAMAFGATEEVSAGTDPVSTILRAAHTSKWGVMLSTGNLWVWGRDFGGDHLVSGYVANTVGRGSTSMLSNAAIFGGSWGDGSGAGSRASFWGYSPSDSSRGVGARGRCDHLNHV